jgi:hypothetical protein
MEDDREFMALLEAGSYFLRLSKLLWWFVDVANARCYQPADVKLLK